MISGATKGIGHDLVAGRYKELMEAAGFVDVQEIRFIWPQNTWPADPKLKELGRWNLANSLDGLQGYSMALMTRVLGMATEEVEVTLAAVRKDMKNRAIHAYWPMQVNLFFVTLPFSMLRLSGCDRLEWCVWHSFSGLTRILHRYYVFGRKPENPHISVPSGVPSTSMWAASVTPAPATATPPVVASVAEPTAAPVSGAETSIPTTGDSLTDSDASASAGAVTSSYTSGSNPSGS